MCSMIDNLDDDCYIFVSSLEPVTKHNFKVTKSFFSAAFTRLSDKNFAADYVNDKMDYLPYLPIEK